MSIELPLTRALSILPFYRCKRDPGKCTQITFQMRNAGSAELNQKICRSAFPGKIKLNNLRGCSIGSFHLGTWFRFGCQKSAVKSVAAAAGCSSRGCSVSDGSSESDGVEKTEMLKLSMKLPNEKTEIHESELESTRGSNIQDGDGQGDNGKGGDGMGKNNGGFGSSEGGNSDRLRGLEWWWWWQWKRAHTRSHTSLSWDYSEPLRLADSVAQVVAVETMRSLEPVVPAIDELIRLLALDQIVFYALVWPFIIPLLFGVHDDVEQMANMTTGAVLAFLTLASFGMLCWLFLSLKNCTDDNSNNSENGDM